MPDSTIGFADHFNHARLAQASGVFEPDFVELLANLDRLSPNIQASPERQSEVEAVPGREHAPAARSVGHWQSRHSGGPSYVYDPDTGGHRRAARALRGHTHAPAFFQPLQHSA